MLAPFVEQQTEFTVFSSHVYTHTHTRTSETHKHTRVSTRAHTQTQPPVTLWAFGSGNLRGNHTKGLTLHDLGLPTAVRCGTCSPLGDKGNSPPEGHIYY